MERQLIGLKMSYVTNVPVRLHWAGLDYVNVFVDAWDSNVPIRVLTSDLFDSTAKAVAVAGSDSFVVASAEVDLSADLSSDVIISIGEILNVPSDDELFG